MEFTDPTGFADNRVICDRLEFRTTGMVLATNISFNIRQREREKEREIEDGFQMEGRVSIHFSSTTLSLIASFEVCLLICYYVKEVRSPLVKSNEAYNE